MKNLIFFCPTHIAFGLNVQKQLTDVLKKNGWKRIGLLVDHNLKDQNAVIELIRIVSDISEHAQIEFCTVTEPTYDDLENIREQYMDKDLQVIVGVGGGSTLDMAKAMAVLVYNRERAIHYRGFDKMTETVLPVVAVPTTAGTGSEVTPNASFVDTLEKRKMGINGEAVRPSYAILDPALTLSCPTEPTVSAAVDSLVHAIEAYTAKKTNPIARLFALEGFKRVFNNLSNLLLSLQDLSLRIEVMYGAFFSGVALMHSGTGPAAAMSYPLGVRYGVPHGIGGGIFLPHVVRHNVEYGLTDYADLYSAIQGADLKADTGKKAELFAESLEKLFAEIGVPDDIIRFGYTSEASSDFIAETMDLKGALDQNPIPFYENEVKNTLRKLSEI